MKVSLKLTVIGKTRFSMRKTSRIFIGIAMAVLSSFLSCNDASSSSDDLPLSSSNSYNNAPSSESSWPPNSSSSAISSSSSSIAMSSSSAIALSCGLPLIIRDDVKEWMEEQFASKGNEKREIQISEMCQVKRNLPIPGEITGDDARLWITLVTAEELAILFEYDSLVIGFNEETGEL